MMSEEAVLARVPWLGGDGEVSEALRVNGRKELVERSENLGVVNADLATGPRD